MNCNQSVYRSLLVFVTVIVMASSARWPPKFVTASLERQTVLAKLLGQSLKSAVCIYAHMPRFQDGDQSHWFSDAVTKTASVLVPPYVEEVTGKHRPARNTTVTYLFKDNQIALLSFASQVAVPKASFLLQYLPIGDKYYDNKAIGLYLIYPQSC